MKKKSPSKSAFFNLRVLGGFALCLVGIVVAIFAFTALPGESARAQASPQNQTGGGPFVGSVVTPIHINKDLRELPYIPPYNPGFEKPEFRRHPRGEGAPVPAVPSGSAGPARKPTAPQPAMPGLNNGFEGIDRATSGCNCSPPDTQGDVGANHYIQNVNSTTFRIWDKNGTVLLTSTLNSLWGTGGTNPCTQGK